MMGLGWMEVLIIGLLALSVLIGIIVLVGVLGFAARSKASGGFRAGNWKAPQLVGQPMQIRVISPTDTPLTSSAKWHGNELQVNSNASGTKCLFDVVLPGLEQCMITYRFRIKTNGNGMSVYPEMWCRIPDRGQFFSRGVDRKVRGAADWVEVEIPFYLEKNQRADLLHLNLVFEGAGSAVLKDIEVQSTAVQS